MADDDVLEDDIDAEELGEEEGEDEEFDEDLEEVDVIDPAADTGDEDDDEDDNATPAKPSEDDDEDDDDEDPDDVEEDLDTILRDRITAGEDDEDDDEDEAPAEVRVEGGDKVPPRAAEEFSCNECFLLVRRSQFSTKRTDCPGGLDGADCPVKNQLGLA